MVSFDHIVIGGGVMGLSTAWNLQCKEKANTLLLDQFPFPNSRNSSSGRSRIYRNAYRQAEYGALMQFAMTEWRNLERLSGRHFVHQCGLLAGGPSMDCDALAVSLRKNAQPFEMLSASQVMQRWPMYANFSPNQRFLYEPGAGFLAADVALYALKDTFEKAGGHFHPNEKVLEIRRGGKSISVVTNRCVYSAGSVVLTAGPWNIQLLHRLGLDIPLTANKTLYTYFPIRQGFKAEHGSKQFEPSFYPVSLYKDLPRKLLVYSIPSFEYPGCVKFGMHAGAACDPDRHDNEPYPRDFELRLRHHVGQRFPQLEAEPLHVEYCMYTNTPDEGFVLDKHPEDKRIVFGAGFSGHGFKLAPAVGKILSDLTMGKSPDFDISKMSLSRFKTRAKL